METLLADLQSSHPWLALDIQSARLLADLATANRKAVLLAVLLVSSGLREGHTCYPLGAAPRPAWWPPELKPPKPAQLLKSGVTARPGLVSPLILDHDDNLFFYRYFQYEQVIRDDLRKRATGLDQVNIQGARQWLATLFPASDNNQAVAAALSLLKRFVVISGGPGTGKTYTAARILTLHQAMATNPLRIGLAAPTGKAAARLQASINKVMASLELDHPRSAPLKGVTLHRLLGSQPERGIFRHCRTCPLDLDLLLVDEASMIGTGLMAALVEALPPSTRLILVGDRDQLAPVDPGNVLADLCNRDQPGRSPELGRRLERLIGKKEQAPLPRSALDECSIFLDTSFRFHQEGAIAGLAQAVRVGNATRIFDLLNQPPGELEFLDPHQDEQRMRQLMIRGFLPVFSAYSPSHALDALEQFRILVGLRQGSRGVAGINRLVEQLLAAEGHIPAGTTWYRGKPIMIQRNHYGLGLYNGDFGIVWPDAHNQLYAWFPGSDSDLLQVPLQRLPRWEPGYGITIHKAQGSEFGTVLLLLPMAEVQVLTRQLLYTGITRARQRLIVAATPDILQRALSKQSPRYSGLASLGQHASRQ